MEQIDYKEKYEDLIKRIKKMVNCQPTITKLAIESLFPELKESEDEKIRKALIEYHKAQAFLDGKPNNKHVKYVAWLEKQGEQNPADEVGNYDHKEVIQTIINEQKPTAWNEEDEKLVKNLISTLSNLYARNIIEKETKEKYTTWLKSLRHQNRWKPSDEQMKVLQWCMPLWVEPKSKAILESLINDLKKLR